MIKVDSHSWPLTKVNHHAVVQARNSTFGYTGDGPLHYGRGLRPTRVGLPSDVGCGRRVVQKQGMFVLPHCEPLPQFIGP